MVDTLSNKQKEQPVEELPEGIEAVEEGAEDTTQRAYFGSEVSKYPFEPNPNLHYLLVHEHPPQWGLESQFGRVQRMGYDFVQWANEAHTCAWYSIPQVEYDKYVADCRKTRDETRQRARDMAKTGDPNTSPVSSWVQTDTYHRGGHLINPPVSFKS